MNEIVEGVNTVYHSDGSTTTYTVEHMPAMEPMTGKELGATLLITFGLMGAMIAVPIGLEKWLSRRDDKKELAHRQKLNKEIFHQAKHA
jgi:hypothetical protein